MKHKGLVAVLLCAALVAAFALAGCSKGETYTPQSKSPEVSSPAIAQAGTLRVGVNTGNPPMAGQSSSIVGIDVDIAAALADELGLKLEIVDVANGAVEALKAGKIDIAMGIDASTNKDTDIWASEVYLQTAVALFATDPSAPLPTADAKGSIAAQVSSLSAWTVTNEFGADILKSEADLATAFSDLTSGQVKYVASDAIVGSYAAHSSGVKASIIGLTQEPAGYSVIVSGKNASLQTVIASKLKELSSNGVISLIEKKWLGSTLDLSKIKTTAGAKNNSATAQAEKKAAEEEEKKKKEEEEKEKNGEGSDKKSDANEKKADTAAGANAVQ